jgi:hypothetical protein
MSRRGEKTSLLLSLLGHQLRMRARPKCETGHASPSHRQIPKRFPSALARSAHRRSHTLRPRAAPTAHSEPSLRGASGTSSMATEGGAGSQETFEARVKRLFGSGLLDAVPDKSFPAASWSVATGDVERHRWARPSEARDAEEELADRGDTPCASAFYDANGCLRGRRRRPKQRLEDDLGELGEDEEERRRKTAEEDEEEGVRVSIGLDPTLDREVRKISFVLI